VFVQTVSSWLAIATTNGRALQVGVSANTTQFCKMDPIKFHAGGGFCKYTTSRAGLHDGFNKNWVAN
jgi:hypothetical protein